MLVNVNAGHGRKHVSMWHIFHEMILAARVRLIDEEYGNVYESAESVYPRGMFLEMILAASFRLLIRNMEMFMKALKVCIHVAYSLKLFLRQGFA